jgi:hypothetical protein
MSNVILIFFYSWSRRKLISSRTKTEKSAKLKSRRNWISLVRCRFRIRDFDFVDKSGFGFAFYLDSRFIWIRVLFGFAFYLDSRFIWIRVLFRFAFYLDSHFRFAFFLDSHFRFAFFLDSRFFLDSHFRYAFSIRIFDSHLEFGVLDSAFWNSGFLSIFNIIWILSTTLT